MSFILGHLKRAESYLLERGDEGDYHAAETCHRAYKYIEDMEGDVKFLRCLEACGVDNWEGYDEAREMMEDV